MKKILCALKIQRAHFFKELLSKLFRDIAQHDDLREESTSLNINKRLFSRRCIKYSLLSRFTTK